MAKTMQKPFLQRICRRNTLTIIAENRAQGKECLAPVIWICSNWWTLPECGSFWLTNDIHFSLYWIASSMKFWPYLIHKSILSLFLSLLSWESLLNPNFFSKIRVLTAISSNRADCQQKSIVEKQARKRTSTQANRLKLPGGCRLQYSVFCKKVFCFDFSTLVV